MNKIYEEGKVPQELRHSVFIALPKKPKAQDCENFRTISLMSHVTKILQKVLLNRMKGTLRAEIAECQYGFLPEKSTRIAIFILRVLAEMHSSKPNVILLLHRLYKGLRPGPA